METIFFSSCFSTHMQEDNTDKSISHLNVLLGVQRTSAVIWISEAAASIYSKFQVFSCQALPATPPQRHPWSSKTGNRTQSNSSSVDLCYCCCCRRRGHLLLIFLILHYDGLKKMYTMISLNCHVNMSTHSSISCKNAEQTRIDPPGEDETKNKAVSILIRLYRYH